MTSMTSTVDTEANGPRGLTDEELAIARRTGDAVPDPAPDRGATPDDRRAEPPAPPVAGGEPTLHPAGTPGAAAGGAGADGLITATVLALYTTSNPAGGWVHLDQKGWCELAGVGLIPIAAAARTAGGQAVVRLGADGKVAEMYVW